MISHTCADVLGVVQSVGPLTTVNRKSNNEEIPKRDVVLVDQRYVDAYGLYQCIHLVLVAFKERLSALERIEAVESH